ncbi:MAG: phosphoenolpyruvate--protein phosphotransferase [Myxococcales bacterium]|nr:phosphoenolpyruvate--protein phosphotransferase [Myxococcales bacterium]
MTNRGNNQLGRTVVPQGTGVVLQGIGVSPGYAIGRVHLLDRRRMRVPKYHVSPTELDAELERFDQALNESEAQITEIKSRLQSAGEEHFLILDAHLLILRDEMLVDGARLIIKEQALNAEWALKKTVKSIRQIFEKIEDEYFRERRADVDFVGDRILRNLMGSAQPALSQVLPDAVIIGHDLSPADTAFLLRTHVLGFATDVGGKTSHTAIMARSLELPAVVGVGQLSEKVGTGDMIILDGTTGEVILSPSPELLRLYQHKQMAYSARRAQLDLHKTEPARTRDGVTLRIAGNIELHEEAMILLEAGAEGVGLYRTEYLFMNRETLPSEDEQYLHYRHVVEKCGDRGATIRTLDLGGDKFLNNLKLGRELNPAMGLRAIRFCLREPGIYKAQLRALLRASAHGELRIMLPLISGLSEVRAVKVLLAECRQELAAAEVQMAESVPLGIMIELPSAAIIADMLAREVDFFAIGTNDLIQYTLAIDRANEHVAYLYQPLHPALLRMLRFIVDSARSAGIKVSMCGEMAGDAFFTAILIGLGLDELSMTAVSIPLIKQVVRSLDASACRALLDEVAHMDDAPEIERYIAERLPGLLGGAVPTEVFDPLQHIRSHD